MPTLIRDFGFIHVIFTCNFNIDRGGGCDRVMVVAGWGVLLAWTIVGQEPAVLAFGATGGCLYYKYLSWVYDVERIEISVTRVTDRQYEACRVMPNSDPE